MQAFAAFVMQSRARAIGACVVFGLLPFVHWLGVAVVALVVLRRGMTEGSIVLLSTCVPLALWYTVSPDPTAIMVLLGTFVLALVLRTTVSWQLTLAASVLVTVVSALVFEVVASGVVDRMVQWYMEFLKAVNQDIPEAHVRQMLLGFFAMGQGYAMIGSLLLGRWWQSLLYNPGGFQAEFHKLRLPQWMSTVLVTVMVVMFAVGTPAWVRWIPVMTVPMIISAIGLVHWIVKAKKLATGWLVAFYLLALGMAQLVYPLLASLALMDSWADLRNRIRTEEPDNEV